MISVDNANFATSGAGFWSTACETVIVTGLELAYCNEEADFGELRVYFDTKTWNVEEHGLIYTDPLWMHEFKHWLMQNGYAADDVGYSEAGMQGDDYVSLDVGAEFISSFSAQ